MRPLGAGGAQGPRGPAPRAAEQVRVCCWTGGSASPQGALAEASGTTVRAAACHSPERAEVTEGPGSQPWLVTDAMGVCVGVGGRGDVLRNSSSRVFLCCRGRDLAPQQLRASCT